MTKKDMIRVNNLNYINVAAYALEMVRFSDSIDGNKLNVVREKLRVLQVISACKITAELKKEK